jgi:heme/copper-type cytochrome/quinol oxidase subunit 1
MHIVYWVVIILGAGFFVYGIRHLLTAMQQRAEGQTNDSVGVAVIFLLIGFLAIVIGVSVLMGGYYEFSSG